MKKSKVKQNDDRHTHTHTNGEFRTKRIVSPRETSWDTDGDVGLVWPRLLITHEQRRAFNSYGTRGPWAHRNGEAANNFPIPTGVWPMVTSKLQRRHLQMSTRTSHKKLTDNTRKTSHLNSIHSVVFAALSTQRRDCGRMAWALGIQRCVCGGRLASALSIQARACGRASF